MSFVQTPVKGMQDFLPEDMALRQHVLGLIRDTYRRYGFSQIGTPAMEHIQNLTGKNGGENEKLIFKEEPSEGTAGRRDFSGRSRYTACGQCAAV